MVFLYDGTKCEQCISKPKLYNGFDIPICDCEIDFTNEKIIDQVTIFDMKKIDVSTIPYTTKKLCLVNCFVTNLEFLPIDLESLDLYEVFTDASYFDLPPKVKNFKITYIGRNWTWQNQRQFVNCYPLKTNEKMINNIYYHCELVDFTNKYIKDNRIMCYNKAT